MEFTNHVNEYDTAKTVLIVDDKYDYVNQWFLMGSPVPLFLIIVSYLTFVLKVGPELMSKRKPFQLRKLLLFYNLIQVVVSYGLFRMCNGIILKYGLVPKKCMLSDDTWRYEFSVGMYWYVAAKLSELLDTVLFVLRKKNNQVTFLHVYHHALMAVLPWAALKYDVQYVFICLGYINSFVHVVMYFYYGLSSFASLSKYLWWKKYITTMQMVQFVMIIIHYGVTYAVVDCKPSNILSFVIIFNLLLFLYMFGKFYVDSYIKRNSSGDDKLKNAKNNKVYSQNNVDTHKNGNANGTAVNNNMIPLKTLT